MTPEEYYKNRKPRRARHRHDPSNPLESDIQAQCVEWFRLQYPHYTKLLWANPNGGSRHVLEAVNLKRQGVLSGVPDVTLAVPRGAYHGAYFELKRKGGKLSDAQEDVIGQLTMIGYYCAVVFSFDEFREVVQGYLE